MNHLFSLGIILIASKSFGLLSKRAKMPQLIGSLLVGVMLGPAMLGIIRYDEIIKVIAELGVIVIMFEAGLDTNIKVFKENITKYTLIGLSGMFVPILLGVTFVRYFEDHFWTCLFISLAIASTSISISVETLQELGKLKSTIGNTVVGSALVDDITGIVLFSMLIGHTVEEQASFRYTLFNLLIFFIGAIILARFLHWFFVWLVEKGGRKRRISVFAFAVCLIFSYVAQLFGVTDIIGAYIAGLVFSNTSKSEYIRSKVEVLSYMLLSPVFFASIGISIVAISMDFDMLFYAALLICLAIFGKVLGVMIGAKSGGFSLKSSFKVSLGMIARGELSLIIANKGKELGLLNDKLFTAIVVMVMVTMVISPLLLGLVYRYDTENEA
jgi:Kef-type K+ transport system membrane component KefB